MTAALTEVRQWITTSETAETFFSRIAIERPPLLIPPLHRLPLRPGNVVEIAGPFPSAKSHILLQAVVNCILPKEWNGVRYGGLEQPVMFIDLDCRFDVLRLVQLIKFRISSTHRSGVAVSCGLGDTGDLILDEELVSRCLERFLYVRCYDSLELLATLKTLHFQLQQNLVTRVRFLMIDSIGAYFWVDRASTSLPLGSNNRSFGVGGRVGELDELCVHNALDLMAMRDILKQEYGPRKLKIFSLQSVIEAVVHEIQNLMQIQSMLVLATKATIFGDRNFRKWSSHDSSGQTKTERCSDNIVHREYMPSAWQSFITHRTFVQPSSLEQHAGNYNSSSEQVYLAKWLQPSLGFMDKFGVRDAGIFVVS